MQTKLTLRLDQELVEKAKFYAAEHGKSVSQMVADYFRFLDAQPAPTASPDAAMGNKTQALKGLLKKANINEDDYNQYRTDKYL
ncbi:MAG: antitoxin [Pseudomonadales bacterium]|nr:antitoxin [Pseudomonadales bacterium]